MAKPATDRTTKPATPAAIRRAAMNLLARREHAYLELERKLTQRFPEATTLIPPALNQLREEGLQSDARLAEAVVTFRSAKGMGPAKITAELQEKGVAKPLITAALEASGIDWPALAQATAQKKFPDVLDAPNLPLPERARIARFLHQRGFTCEQVARLPAKAARPGPASQVANPPQLR